MLRCVFTVPPGKGPELLPQRQLGFWPLRQVDGSCATQQSQGGNSSASETVISGDQELGTPDLALFCFAVPLAVLFPSTSASLKNKLAFYDRQLYVKRGCCLSHVFFTNEASNGP